MYSNHSKKFQQDFRRISQGTGVALEQVVGMIIFFARNCNTSSPYQLACIIQHEVTTFRSWRAIID